jgi:hypothetical protein
MANHILTVTSVTSFIRRWTVASRYCNCDVLTAAAYCSTAAPAAQFLSARTANVNANVARLLYCRSSPVDAFVHSVWCEWWVVCVHCCLASWSVGCCCVMARTAHFAGCERLTVDTQCDDVMPLTKRCLHSTAPKWCRLRMLRHLSLVYWVCLRLTVTEIVFLVQFPDDHSSANWCIGCNVPSCWGLSAWARPWWSLCVGDVFTCTHHNNYHVCFELNI